jgi:2-hydroxy-4-carboxymuconate semialdehyde hemiacetal dehydrogenase
MKIRVAMIGCGTVGLIHAAHLIAQADVELVAVYSPEHENAASFAARFGVRTIATSIDEAIALADVAIICSPSALHFEQSRECLRAGRHVLSEFPPCDEPSEAEELGAIAQKQGVLLGCAHTSRYLAPYARIHAALKSGRIGEIQNVSYVRYPQLRPRTWTDNALVHHGAHFIDLVLQWCGELKPIACAAYPNASSAQSVSILAALSGGKPLTATIGYGAKIPMSRMVVVGTAHTVETDGFSYLRSDLEELQFVGDERAVYVQAIAAQDAQFLDACRRKNAYIPWAETEILMQTIHRFRILSATGIDISKLDRSEKNLIFD